MHFWGKKSARTLQTAGKVHEKSRCALHFGMQRCNGFGQGRAVYLLVVFALSRLFGAQARLAL